jgi:hypothetical protein
VAACHARIASRGESLCRARGIVPQNCHDCDLSLFLNPQ